MCVHACLCVYVCVHMDMHTESPLNFNSKPFIQNSCPAYRVSLYITDNLIDNINNYNILQGKCIRSPFL
jgi:hypothetical protein